MPKINEKKVKEALKNVLEHGWQIVNLRNCGLTKIPDELFKHPDIVSIDLGNDDYLDEDERNQITEIPSEISKIKRLAKLNFENNKVGKVSENVAQLDRLHYLNLDGNELRDLPEKIANMDGLKELKISNNPFDILPPEIVARGIDSIRNFIKELEEKDFIYEVKLIIVGEGRVGKTCLSRALIDDDYVLTDEESTEGINIDRWVIPKNDIQQINNNIDRDFQINIWDFGGQEIYHSTHQFFLTKRSIYLLVTESRKEDRHDDFFYWLNIIRLLGRKSPVMMVLNKCDQPTKELPIKEYQASFQNIVSFHKISLKNEFRNDLYDFKKEIKEIASKLPHIGNPLPKVWVDIRREIEELKLSGKHYIPITEYFELCRKYYRNEESALFLSEYFHDLGVIIHFQNEVDLRDIVFLNHEWITKGVYKILDDKLVIDQHGKFSHDDILRIWSDDEYKNRVRELISLMKNTKFDLCFELASGEYLVPRLLPVDEIEHQWEISSENSKFEFRYKFMPKGILARLIVKMNSDIFENKYWRYGVLLKYEDTMAIIREKYFENKISIELNGTHKREFLYLIRKNITEIHKDYNKLEVQEMVPCNCQYCSNNENPHFFSFELLRRYERNGINDTRCDISLEEIEVFKLTSDIARKSLSEEKIIVCENLNATVLNKVHFEKIKFFPENNSNSVFIKTKTDPDIYGLRDRDFLLDDEIIKIKKRYPNYFILNYYCFENYLYHPDNLEELKLQGFNKEKYIEEIKSQKESVKLEIISNFKKSRDSYQEFRVDTEKLRLRNKEHEVMAALNSPVFETFYKFFDMKSKFQKNCLETYQLSHEELANTQWFKNQIFKILELD